jgi:porphobilinogen deaminase
MSHTLNSSPNLTPIQTPKRLVIASRESRLAMWQALHAQACLKKPYPDCDIQILGLPTRGDQILDKILSKIGGKAICLASGNGPVESVQDAEALGLTVAKDLPAQGAADLIPALHKDSQISSYMLILIPSNYKR